MTDLNDAVTAGVLAGERSHDELLQSIVEVGRAFFAAKAASITLLDEGTNELVFEAVSGEGSDSLVGTRFPANAGVAGFVATAGQSLVLDDVSKDPRFARDVAEGTGYVPRALIAAPLLRGERVLGVLSVLDRRDNEPFGLEQMNLLELFAEEAAIALEIVQASRGARAALESSEELAAITRLVEAVGAGDERRRAAGLRLLEALGELLEPS